MLFRSEERLERREQEREAFYARREERREERRNRRAAHEEEAIPKRKKELPKSDQVELIQDEIVINNFNEPEEELATEKKGMFGLFGKKKMGGDMIDDVEPEKFEEPENNPDELENIFKEEKEEKEEKTKAVLQLDHQTHTVDDENYEMPPVNLLSQAAGKVAKGSKKVLTDTATKLQKTLYSFGVSAKVENVSVGPVITRYELKPAEGVRVSKIAKLSRSEERRVGKECT